jgi:hypothetical protein
MGLDRAAGLPQIQVSPPQGIQTVGSKGYDGFTIALVEEREFSLVPDFALRRRGVLWRRRVGSRGNVAEGRDMQSGFCAAPAAHQHRS